jgi:transmembrane sensor
VNWEILLKHINNESSAAENAEMENWLDEQAEHKHLLQYLQKRKEQLQQPLKQNDVHEQWVLLLDRIFEQHPVAGKPKPHQGYWLMGIAASLLVVSLLGWFYHSQSNLDRQSVSLQTPGTKRGTVTLPDGSLVYMAPDSKLTYASDFGVKKRELHLTGEAFFNVKHNANSPFIIHAENHLSVTVLGTSFNVYSRSNQNTEVKVATGLVGVTNGKRTSFLKAGEQLSYVINSRQLLFKTVERNDAAALQNQTLFFKNNNAGEIAEKLHRWYNVNVQVSAAASKHPRFSGEMQDTGLENLLKGLGYATGLHYRYTNPHTIILY